MADLLPFLGLDAHAAVDAFLPKIQDATEKSYHAKKQVRHYIENHSRRVGRYRENLTTEQLHEVVEVCGPLLDELRQELAEGYLRQPNLSVDEVAFLLGYSERSAFHRAFRRWTGRAPRSRPGAV